jgi:hypothetical protein
MLNEQLKTQITDEGEAIADRLKDNNDYQAGMIRGYKDGYEAGGYIYADKWQEAEQRASESRKLLDEVFRKHESGLLPDRFVYEKIKSFLYPTAKTTTDDTVNG